MQNKSVLFASQWQAEADLELTAAKIKEDSAGLMVRQTLMKQEEEKLAKEKKDLENARATFEEEKDRIGKLGLELQKRSRDIEELSVVRTSLCNYLFHYFVTRIFFR